MAQTLHILHLEDNPYDAELVQEKILGEGIEAVITVVDSRESFVTAVIQAQFDLILADFVLPSFDGQTALILAQERCPDVPFIFVSGAIGEEKAIESLKLGATDYVLKDHLSGLLPAIRRALSEVEERSQRQQAMEQLHQSRDQLAAILQGITEGITVQTPDGRLIYANEIAARLVGYPTVEALIEAAVTDFGQKFELLDEDGNPFPFTNLPGRLALQGQQTTDVLLRFRHLSNSDEHWSVVSATPIFNEEGELQFAVNIFRDVTERTHLYQAEKEARQKAEATAVRIASLQVVTASLAEALTPTEVIQVVVEQIIAIMGVQVSTVILRNDQNNLLELVHAIGLTPETLSSWRHFPLDAPVPSAEAIRTGEPIFLESLAAAAAYPELIARAGKGGNQAWASIPLNVQGKTIGAMGLAFNKPQIFTEEDRDFLVALGRQCAQALERARLYLETSQLNLDLEQRVVERTKALKISNQQLQQINIRLEEEIGAREHAQERLQIQAARTAVLVRTAARLNAELDLNTVLAAVCEEAVQALSVGIGTISLYDSKQDALLHTWDYGLPMPNDFREQGKPIPRKLYDKYMWQAEPVFVVRNVKEAPRFPNADLYVSLGVRSLACAGMFRQGQLVGLLNIGATGKIRNFSENELALLQGLVSQAAVAIQNALLHQQVSTAREQLRRVTQQVVTAQEEERQRISRELHDEAGQALTALAISLELIQNSLPPDLPLVSERLTQAASLTRETMEQIRLLAKDLRPPSLDMWGLDLTLEGFCLDFARRTQLNIHYAGAQLPPLPGVVSITFYRVLQEALANIARHAQAKNVQVALAYEGQKVSLIVADDGQGFDVSAALVVATGRPGGNGLFGMRERMDLLGGSLEIESRPGQGMRLIAATPALSVS